MASVVLMLKERSCKWKRDQQYVVESHNLEWKSTSTVWQASYRHTFIKKRTKPRVGGGRAWSWLGEGKGGGGGPSYEGGGGGIGNFWRSTGEGVRTFPSVIMKNVSAFLEGGCLQISHYSYNIRLFS